LSNLIKNWIFSAIIIFVWISLGTSGFGDDHRVLKADGNTDVMPIRWEQAFLKLVTAPDKAKLEQGEILCEIKKKDGGTITAQSLGLIKAKTEDCFKVVRNYNQYVTLMPCTKESRVVRSFQLEGEHTGVEAVDFWTRIRVLGNSTRCLLRIAHLPDLVKQQFRSFWTLVDRPEHLPACIDSEKKACRNNLIVNLGSHQFEPFPGNSNYTLHTYTLTVSGKSRLQQTAFHLGGAKSLGDVTQAIRNVLEK